MRTFLLVFSTLVLAASTAAQKKPPKWRIDPYTKNDPKAIAAAGYVSYGPFEFGCIGDTPKTTTDIEDKLPYAQILWIETPHFRLGCNLPQWSVPMDMPTRTKIRTELTELKKKLPKVNPKARRLDPWLRAHLFAWRLEKLYAETQALFGVTDADFPPNPDEVIIEEGKRYMGHGRYLGMKDKYLVLLFEELGTYQQYLSHFVGRDTKYPQRWHFKQVGSLMFATAENCENTDLRHDTAMHCAISYLSIW